MILSFSGVFAEILEPQIEQNERYRGCEDCVFVSACGWAVDKLDGDRGWKERKCRGRAEMRLSEEGGSLGTGSGRDGVVETAGKGAEGGERVERWVRGSGSGSEERKEQGDRTRAYVFRNHPRIRM